MQEEVQGEDSPVEFDFDRHRAVAERAYQLVRPAYGDFASTVESILRVALDVANVDITSIESRAKTIESFGRKAAQSKTPSLDAPKYIEPLAQVMDLAGARVITYFLSSVREADRCIREEFDVIEVTDKREGLNREAKLGYQSVHYLVKLNSRRLILPEYLRFEGMVAEVQVRTILQHAWAEIEHDIQYKSVDTLPAEIRRRFIALAGMLEIGDREFQELSNAHDRIQNEARAAVEADDLDGIEITPDALRAFLDKRLGSDGRVKEWGYAWEADLLKVLGFSTLEQVSEAIDGLDDDRLSRIVYGGRQGQITRFEILLRVAMGDGFLNGHPWNTDDSPWVRQQHEHIVRRLRDADINIGNYLPPGSSASRAAVRGD
jgi:ppGpp synthetase/RelA/SpoT-type nucleotidyltranferase